MTRVSRGADNVMTRPVLIAGQPLRNVLCVGRPATGAVRNAIPHEPAVINAGHPMTDAGLGAVAI
jgi:hypothetical protein